MNRARDQFFSGAGLSHDQHRSGCRGHRLNLRQYLPEDVTFTDQQSKIALLLHLLGQISVLLCQLLAQLGQLLISPHILDRQRHLDRNLPQKIQCLIIRLS